MGITNSDLLQHFSDLLQINKIKDYCPNGLQVEGSRQINKIVTGVTASQALIDLAIEKQADAIVVHHGYFWKGEDPCIKGMKKRRLASLLANDINLYAFHLPLDIHPTLGNNAQLAAMLGITSSTGLEVSNPYSIAMQGFFEQPIRHADLVSRIQTKLGSKVLSEGDREGEIKSVAWCTGGGQSYIDMAAEQEIDAFITGEVSEQTIHTAREMNIHFFAAGHHATERYGAKALGEHIAREFDLDVEFVDVANPA